MLTEDAVLVVPGMILDRTTFLANLDRQPEAGSMRIEEPLLYRVVAELPEGGAWTSFMSSTYVRRSGGWRLAYHQQTPTS